MKTQITLTIDKVEFSIETLDEHLPVRGNLIVSGDDKFDRIQENKVIGRLNRGDRWAWCLVRVVARFRGLEGQAFLGGCSYRNEQDFIDGGYFDDMKREAFDDLMNQVQDIVDGATE